ncbi:hypothetical protein M406DRAFT_334441 [Cryphonectria parasitica EP155]|uniref:BZIP transcription factor n=1 Tax=Cryphonectria parasitica (strain ATCC 38755 / EP155) TaxID=660469 RepID=A0A9P4XT87_CRYP1|nr:uncharacterized protein M406DRAFT_334441 [Cryphonectria parasitica EP155]KAF3760822.1 hypothetical protein M406DRAFT_334441 [Cryphonectria parasitica EP155]
MTYATTSHVRTTAPIPAPIDTNIDMDRDSPRTSSTSSGEHKSTKRKGTRSVSTLTPSQLARKRANDREAQRAIRARTKEHIEKLETEVARLRSIADRDQEYQRLIRRIQALEDENKALRSGVPVAPSEPYGVYDDAHSSLHSSPVVGRSSAYGHGIRATSDPYSSYPHMPTPAPEAWDSTIPVTVPTSVSSPASCAPEEYGRFMTTAAVSAPLIDSIAAPTSVPYHSGSQVEFEAGVDSEHSFQSRPTSGHQHGPGSQQYSMHQSAQQPWNQAAYSTMYGVSQAPYPNLP